MGVERSAIWQWPSSREIFLGIQIFIGITNSEVITKYSNHHVLYDLKFK